MRGDFIIGKLPKNVIIDGREYPVNWGFRIGMQFDRIRDSERRDEDKLIRLLRLYYPVIPANLEEAIHKMIWFYRCGEDEEKEEDNKQRYQRRTQNGAAYSFIQDTPYIYAAFKEQYGIDLEDSDMHWWKFMALFESLSENTKMSKIMYYRKASTSGMDRKQRAFVNEMKKLYQIKELSSIRKKMSLEERNRKWRLYVKERQKELKP